MCTVFVRVSVSVCVDVIYWAVEGSGRLLRGGLCEPQCVLSCGGVGQSWI